MTVKIIEVAGLVDSIERFLAPLARSGNAAVPQESITEDGGPESKEAADQTFSDAGMTTVEYAIGTVVAAAFAAVLYRIVTGDSVVDGLTSLVQSALNTNF